MKKALIIGHTGQDGTYLFRLLESKGYNVLGISRQRTDHSLDQIHTQIDILDREAVKVFVQEFQPDEIYYLAASHQSSSEIEKDVGGLFKSSIETNLMGLVNFLESIRLVSPGSRLFYAASSHVFGDPLETPQDETTSFRPNCIYGISKTAGVGACEFYRTSHDVFASVGIFYNHESPLRATKYVSQKIVRAAVEIKEQKSDILELGNLETAIDWGFAPDYVLAANCILNFDRPDNFIISSGETHTIKEFVEEAFGYLNLDWTKYVVENKSVVNKKQKNQLFGNNKKLKKMTGWNNSFSFSQLVRHMVDEAKSDNT